MRIKLLIGLSFLLLQCSGPEPRKPVKVRTGSFLKESVERNRELLAKEEQLIRSIIESDSLHNYLSTDFGAWYFYEKQMTEESPLPTEDDRVSLSYNMIGLDNDTIYSNEEIGRLIFRLDKEELFPGLRMGVKLLREGEIAKFLFPSHLVYGYHGDGSKIGPNIPVKSTISILNIEQLKDSILN